jgi:hypothetical protein
MADLPNDPVNIYNAIMRAADLIERTPQLYAYHNIYVPKCGSPACALGWIGHFAGAKDSGRTDGLTNVGYVGDFVLGEDSVDFYNFMDLHTGKNWRDDARECARGMRIYAGDRFAEQAPGFGFSRFCTATLTALKETQP